MCREFTEALSARMSPSSPRILFERLFGLKKNGTTVRMEIVAGVTTIMTMAFTYSVSDGILWGIIGHAGIHLFAGRGREVHWVVCVLPALFIAKSALICPL